MPRAVTTAVVVRFSHEQRARIAAAADEDGLSPGPWLRNLALERARYVLDPAPADFVRSKVEGVREHLRAKGLVK